MRQWKSRLSIVISCITCFLLFGVNAFPSTVNIPEKSAYIPDVLIDVSSDSAIVVDKKKQKIFTFRRSKGSFKKVFEATCSTGKNSGAKAELGDGKTPEGILYATKLYRDEELSSTYGCMAFHLNYPNLIDRKEGRNGNNIWIHGTNKPLQAYQSNGCITMTNKDIQRLSRYIKLHRTPIVIEDQIQWVPRAARIPIQKELKSILDSWAQAVTKGDIKKLALLYDDEQSMDKLTLNQLMEHTAKWRSEGVDVSLYPSHVSLLNYDRYAIATFDQTISSDDLSSSFGYRKLFLRKKPDTWHITGDLLQSPTTEQQFIASLHGFDTTVTNHTIIRKTIKNWIKSWESGNMQKYSSLYAPDFKGYGMNLKQWISYKNNVNKENKNIRITIENVKISEGSKTIKACFTQWYDSSKHSDIGIKKLLFKKVHGQWRIYRESWKPMKE